MENQKGNVVPNKHKVPSVIRKPPRLSQLTVVIAGNVGKVRSFKISSRFLFWTLVFFVLYIIGSVIIINKYFDELNSNKAQSTLTKRMKNEIKDMKTELFHSRQHASVLEEAIADREVADNKTVEPATSEPVEEKQEEKKPESAVENQPIEKVKKETEPRKTLIDIKDLGVRKESRKLKISFKLINLGQEKGSVKGYTYIIAVNNNINPPQLLPYPNVELQSGIPVNYKLGQPFIIKRFKEIRGEYSIDSDTKLPSSMKILVYDKSGALILQKEFDIEGVS